MRKVSFDIEQNSEPSKLRILFRICFPKRFTSPEGTFRIGHYVFHLPHFAVSHMALVLLLPSLWCQKMPGSSPPRPEEVRAYPVPPVVSRFASTWIACTYTSNLTEDRTSRCSNGGKVLSSPYAHPSPATPFGDLEGGHKWLRHHFPSELQQFTPYALMESLLPTNSLQSSPLTPSLLTFFPGKKLAHSYQGCDKAWLAVPLLRCPS